VRNYWIPRGARRAGVAVAGSMVVVVGLALLVLPGPGLLLLTAGLALLATEFAWAQRWLTRLRGHTRLTVQRVRPAKPSA
jgi:hypothetical protein